jgi:hypothetical protein
MDIGGTRIQRTKLVLIKFRFVIQICNDDLDKILCIDLDKNSGLLYRSIYTSVSTVPFSQMTARKEHSNFCQKDS